MVGMSSLSLKCNIYVCTGWSIPMPCRMLATSLCGGKCCSTVMTTATPKQQLNKPTRKLAACNYSAALSKRWHGCLLTCHPAGCWRRACVAASATVPSQQQHAEAACGCSAHCRHLPRLRSDTLASAFGCVVHPQGEMLFRLYVMRLLSVKLYCQCAFDIAHHWQEPPCSAAEWSHAVSSFAVMRICQKRGLGSLWPHVKLHA